MNIVEITNILKLLGWSISRDEVGDRLASYGLPDRTADIIYGMKRLTNDQQLWVMRSTSTDAFSNACAVVDSSRRETTPLLTSWKGLRIQAPEILDEHVRQGSEEAIAWAQEQDLDRALQEHAAMPTNVPGAKPIWHLAALALLGNVEKLKSYQSSFEAGDRLGFVPYITKDYIDRAVSLGEEYASGV
ncbi:DUF6990 domain-containing protein [Halomonas binhaiensis]|uniref:Uncharacterized protein n=1 Tax=Halomonas binhaiensis TaxID=2562282 RepID=A0A5C1NHP8_9GAMM|nr:hypothetical protein [Halomonas binhaiensis]QEM81958.1 hypothetical protein E4T21_10620 [Halomonas binhaiensis]